MILTRPPQQRLYPFHLFMAVMLLLLTAYPYLFNNICLSAAAHSTNQHYQLKHSSLDEFDILQSDDLIWSKSFSTRQTRENTPDANYANGNRQSDYQLGSTSSPPQDKTIKKLRFSVKGRQFNLMLSKPSHLVADDLTITTLDADGNAKRFPFSKNNLQIFQGHLVGQEDSQVTASFDEEHKLLTAQITDGPDNIVVIEPTYLHKRSLSYSSSEQDSDAEGEGLYNNTMIVYNLSDHKQFMEDVANFYRGANNCAAVNMQEYRNDSSLSTVDYIGQKSAPIQLSEYDDDVFKYYKFKEEDDPKYRGSRRKRGIEQMIESGREKTRCTLHLVADYSFYKHVGLSDMQTTINYLLALVDRVNKIYLSTIWDTGDDDLSEITRIGFTVHNMTIHQEYTRISSGNEHYNMDTEKVWAARDFLDNFSRNSPPKHYCLAHLLTYRQFDTPVLGLAYVASSRFGTIGGICSPFQQRGNEFLKHNTGISTSRGINGETLITRQADLVVAHELGHNLGAEHDTSECKPSSSNGGAYLMHPYAVLGFEKNNRFFSECSRLSIGRVIRRKGPSCFVAPVDDVCGNGIVEGKEECDGGDPQFGERDPCCDSNCRFSPGSQCSDRHSWCCRMCRIRPAGEQCRPAEEYNCKQKSHCDGRSAECPEPSPVEDNRICVGRGLCLRGDCIPFCEARGLYSCLCNTSADACKLCCKTSINGTCLPYDKKAPHLPDGVLCFRGICEKGRCEQPIQDVVERLWDVIEDINFTAVVKLLRDNIIIVVLLISIPIWCVFTHFINEFDRRVKREVLTAISKSQKQEKPDIGTSPFIPRLFVNEDILNNDMAHSAV